jgi:ribosomal protein L7/L12
MIGDESLAPYYESAIGILSKEQDWKAMCFAIAKKDPKLFCEALGYDPWKLKIKDAYEIGGKINAIKYVREKTGLGLIEAKKAVEAIEEIVSSEQKRAS